MQSTLLFCSTALLPCLISTEWLLLLNTARKVGSNEVQTKLFLSEFFPLCGKNAKGIVKSIPSSLQENGFAVMMCRWQAYHNAFTMAGIHFGVQRRM